ncbi:MAG: Structural maintenance of chromosomes protein 3 [Bogoriella megaspora]|nr:MAG: Structural maintenance of chromosomes protein 3 [Bogoriella megaspora]
MHVKQIIIQGFKSYKEQTVIEPFSPKHNVIVGRNGSGKSNFFAAIRFVLSDAYTQMGREERQALLHEGSGSAVMTAYVEVIFDNEDERFPTGTEEVILRRTIGVKKDEYSLNRKNATKTDVMNLLESAGFSRSNPYYIVPQGRVTTLTNMKDSERLNLLKEVAGTQVYEARRFDSLRLMEESEHKRQRTDESMTSINNRLAELEEEKEELREYQDKDRERRCLEYCIYHQNQVAFTRELDQIEVLQQNRQEDAAENEQKFIEGEQEMDALDESIGNESKEIRILENDKKDFERDRKTWAKNKAQLDIEVKALTDGRSEAAQRRNQLQSHLKNTQSSIQQREADLARLDPEAKQARNEEAGIKAQLDDAEAHRRQLHEKQGRNEHFRSKKERDQWLTEQIDAINMNLATNKATGMQTNEDIAELKVEVTRLEKEASDFQARLDNYDPELRSAEGEVNTTKDRLVQLTDHRKELEREQARLEENLGPAKEQLRKAENSLAKLQDANLRAGLSTVREWKKQGRFQGLHGTIGELLEVDQTYRNIVDATGGRSLFDYVVDDYETAAELSRLLTKHSLGRVTFLPLNGLRGKQANLPQANDAVHLMKKLKFNEDLHNAFSQIFGKTVICPNLQIASQYARSHGVSAVTFDGDQADKKGALTGGYHDARQSRYDAIQNSKKFGDECDRLQSRLDDVKRQREDLDQQVTNAKSELQKASQKLQQIGNSYGPLRGECRGKLSELERRKIHLETAEKSREGIESDRQRLAQDIQNFETERTSHFQKALSDAEEQQLQTLGARVQALKRQYADLAEKRTRAEEEVSNVRIELNVTLRPTLDQLKAQEIEEGSGGTTGETGLKQAQKDLQRATKAIRTIEEKLRGNEASRDQRSHRLAELQKARDDKQKENEDLAKAIQTQERRLEKSLTRREQLKLQLAEVTKDIRDLGSLPDEAFQKYQNMSVDKAERRLTTVTNALKKYAHVNKKAFEQYNTFIKQRDTLIKRQKELSDGQQSITDLIQLLDQRKDEAIERTFKQVSREFANIFEKLVPAGKGRLIIQRKSDRAARAPQDEDSEDERRDGVENYTGVGISVSFNSKHDEQQRIQQLSGGQKSLCALGLVFAIQACDPAPFYLFDEIDANLDAQYRTAVAQMLQESSQTGQFICTTFRPEMVQVAEKCYGVSYSNKTSSIDVVSTEDALGFVEEQRQ